MAPENAHATDASQPSLDVPAGSFPFPLSDGPNESRYLTWIRNHSNYMAVRGFVDYFRSASVLLRGIILNFLIFLPSLLLVAIVLAYSHHWMLRNPFLLTLSSVGVAMVAILLYPIGVQLFKIASHKRSLSTGSDSSVKRRDVHERRFGGLLLLILAIAFVESLPWLLEFVHGALQKGKLSWQGGFSAVVAALTLLSGSDKLLSVLSGAKKTLVMGLIGVLGLLVPMLVIGYATYYLLYGFPPSPDAIRIPILVAIFIVAAIIVAISIGAWQGVFTRREFAATVGLLALATVLLGGALTVAAVAQNKGVEAKEDIVDSLTPFGKLGNAFEKISKRDGLDTEIANLVGEYVIRYREFNEVQEKAQKQAKKRSEVEDEFIPPKLICRNDSDCKPLLERVWEDVHWKNFPTYLIHQRQLWVELSSEYSSGRGLIASLSGLLAQPEIRLAALRAEVAKLARVELDRAIKERVDTGRPDGAIKPKETTEDADLEVALNIAQNSGDPSPLEKRNQIAGKGHHNLKVGQLEKILESKEPRTDADDLIAKLMFGVHAGLERNQNASQALNERISDTTRHSKALFIGLLAVVIGLGCWLTFDVNLTSIHSLYRDRLAAAFLVGKDTEGDVDIEGDLDLHRICRYEDRSIAPYHLINVALNMQASRELKVRDRQSDFFIFSKRFVGGQCTGYCRSENMEQVFPQMSLATAMAISAAAASPNMGRGTSPMLVAFMTLLNIRLGYWVPNPGLLEESANRTRRWRRRRSRSESLLPAGYGFKEILTEELRDIESRWRQVYRNLPDHPDKPDGRRLNDKSQEETVTHGLVGLAFSGGGIRSAAFNLGITQALNQRGVFKHVDYMSTVSGGGYLGSSISTLMRSGEERAERDPTAGAWGRSNIAGDVTVQKSGSKPVGQIVQIQAPSNGEHREYRFSRFDSVVVKTGDRVKVGQDLIRHRDNIGERFRWRARPMAFFREMFSKLDETHRWVNLSDGGHIENLATMELLRRRCRYIIIGDGEADPKLHFAGLATLMRCAYLDLGITIDIDLNAIRLRKANDYDEKATVSGEHWAIGTIRYPMKRNGGERETGYLLYLKSSFSGDESEIIQEYRHRNPTFPHQTTADQFFDEAQFEAYRALGQHIAELALDSKHNTEHAVERPRSESSATDMSYQRFETWFEGLWSTRKPAQTAMRL